MNGLARFWGFATLSALLHVGPWALWSDTGQKAAGGGGEGAVTLDAVSPGLNALVAEWNRPVEASAQAPALKTAALQAAPAHPQPSAQPVPRSAVPGSLTVPQAENPANKPAPLARLPKVPAVPQIARPALQSTDTAGPVIPSAPPPKSQPARPPQQVRTPQSDTAPKVATTAPPPPRPETKPKAKSQPAAKPKAKKPNPQTAGAAQPRAQERAKGAGERSQAGSGTAKDTTGDTRRQAQLIKRWGAQIRSRVERQKRGARSSGKVRLRLSVHTAGRLQGVSLLRSSGNGTLDSAALNAARRARPPKAPKGIKPGSYNFTITVRFN